MSDQKSPGAKFFGSAVRARDDNANLIKKASGTALTPTPGALPDIYANPFWDYAEVDSLAERWDQFFPFQLLLIEKKGGQYNNQNIKARFTLPIPPQELSISTPFASTTAVTLGGIFSEHNGAPLRTITFSGTTGFTPLRQNVVSPGQTFGGSLGASVFGGTIRAAQNVGRQFSQLTSGTPLEGPNIIPEAEAKELAFAKGTGFYQFMLLKRFLEGYAELKRTGQGKSYRLGFAIWKEDEVYLVEPENFDVRRSADRPMEYMYSVKLLAWRRVAFTDSTSPLANGLDLGEGLQNAVNTLVRARRVLLGAKGVLAAVRNDLDRAIITPLRQTLLLLKDSVGVAFSAMDFPAEIIQDFKGPMLEAFAVSSTIDAGLTNSKTLALIAQLRQMSVEQNKIKSAASSTKGGLSANPTAPGNQNDKNAAPPNKAFDDPDSNFDFFDSINPSELNLRPATIAKMEAERDRAASLIQSDFVNFRDSVSSVLDDFEQAIGRGDTQFSDTFDVPERADFKVATDGDWDAVFALNELMMVYDRLIVQTSNLSDTPRDAMEYVAGLASASGIAFKVPRSKYSVPFPYGYTLEKLASQYLGDPGRWHEIAALNGLRSPYVDEVGFTRTLAVNGTGRTVTVSDGTNLFVGQPVWLSSSNVRREKRRIQKVDVLSATQVIITLDGDADLDRFTTAASAFLQAFLPDTVNSQQTLFLPSDDAPSDDGFRIQNIPGIDYYDPMVKVGGIDLLLDQNLDLVVPANGDGRFAVGLTNIVQKVRLALATPLGSVLYHPEYGFPISVGTSSADVTAQDILVASKNLFKDDPTFAGVQSASVSKIGNAVLVRLAIQIAGTGQIVPISVQFK